MKKFNICMCVCVLLMAIQSAFGMEQNLVLDEGSVMPNPAVNNQISLYVAKQRNIFVGITNSDSEDYVGWTTLHTACGTLTTCHLEMFHDTSPATLFATFDLHMQQGDMGIENFISYSTSTDKLQATERNKLWIDITEKGS